MSAAAPVAPPAPERVDPSVYRGILTPAVSRMIYNPGDEPIEFTVAGNTRIIPPFDQYAPKKLWGVAEHEDYPPNAQPGVLPLRDFAGNKKVVGIYGTVVYENLPASEQATFAVGQDGISGPMALRGVRLLSGEPTLDERIRADARAAWQEAIYFADSSVVRSHEQVNAKRQETGTPQVQPSERVRKAYRRKLEYETEKHQDARFACQKCGEPFLAQKERDSHILMIHPDLAGHLGLGRGQAFDGDGNPIEIDVAASLAAGPTGALRGYRLVKVGPDGNEIAGQWIGETPEEFQVRMSGRTVMSGRTAQAQDAVSSTVLEPLLEEIAQLKAKFEMLARGGAVPAVHAGGRGRKRKAARKAPAPVPAETKEG